MIVLKGHYRDNRALKLMTELLHRRQPYHHHSVSFQFTFPTSLSGTLPPNAAATCYAIEGEIPNSKHRFTTSFLPWRKVPESDARSVGHSQTPSTGLRHISGKICSECGALLIFAYLSAGITPVSTLSAPESVVCVATNLPPFEHQQKNC